MIRKMVMDKDTHSLNYIAKSSYMYQQSMGRGSILDKHISNVSVPTNSLYIGNLYSGYDMLISRNIVYTLGFSIKDINDR